MHNVGWGCAEILPNLVSSFDESMFAGKGQLIAICQFFSHYSGSDVKSEAKTPSGEHLLSMDKVFK